MKNREEESSERERGREKRERKRESTLRAMLHGLAWTKEGSLNPRVVSDRRTVGPPSFAFGAPRAVCLVKAANGQSRSSGRAVRNEDRKNQSTTNIERKSVHRCTGLPVKTKETGKQRNNIVLALPQVYWRRFRFLVEKVEETSCSYQNLFYRNRLGFVYVAKSFSRIVSLEINAETRPKC